MTSDLRRDATSDVLRRDIFGSSAGGVMLNELWEDMLGNIPRLSRRDGLRILAADGGAGQIAVRLGELGHEVVLCNPTPEILDRAQHAVDEAQVGERVSLVCAPIAEYDSAVEGAFDLITCHSALEWITDPHDALDELVSFLRLDGELSLMFYNRKARLLNLILNGAFDNPRHDSHAAPPEGSGQCANALFEEDVALWIAELALSVRSKTAIHIFHDAALADFKGPGSLGGLRNTEQEIRQQEPFSSLGEHTHLVCARADATPADR